MMDTVTKPQLDFEAASQRLNGVVKRTPLEYNAGLSEKYDCEIWLKREDLRDCQFIYNCAALIT